MNDFSEAGFIAIFGGFLILFILIAVAILSVQIIATWKVFKKAGKNGWEAIVPFYSNWVLCEITEVKWWFFLIMLSPTICSMLGLAIFAPLALLCSLAANFAANYNLALKFGKDPVGYGIGLTLLPIIFYPILAFGNASFDNVSVSSYGPIEEDKIEKNNNVNTSSSKTKSTTKKSGKFCKNCGSELSDGKFCPNCGSEIK